MGKRLVIIISILCCSMCLWSQVIKGSLLNAGACWYKQRIIVYGYEQHKDQLLFKCFSYSKTLQLKDSSSFALGKHSAEHYLQVSQDTFHDVLSFYFQPADQSNKVSLWRLDSTLKTIGTATDYDANHINSFTAFGDEHYRYKNKLYIITTTEDSTGKQFYLSAYQVKALDKPFEYDFEWQHAFERKHIQRATIISATTNQVTVYAHVNDGLKKGQWILHINARTGQLIKGTKLNPKGDERHYLYSKSLYNTTDKSMEIAGSIYPAAMIDFKNQRSDFKGLSALHQLFLIHIDSLGDITSRFEKAVPLPSINKAGAVALPLHFKIRTFSKEINNAYSIWADLYEEQQVNVMSYSSSMEVKLTPIEESFSVSTSTVYPVQKLIPDLISNTKGNAYGRLVLNSAADYGRFKYVDPINPVVLHTANDASGNPYYIVRKINTLSGQKSFYEVLNGKKGVELKSLFSTIKGQTAQLFMIGNSFVSFTTDAANTGYELKVNTL